MLNTDQHQMLAALGIPTGPGIPLPAGAGSVYQSPSAGWTRQLNPMMMSKVKPGIGTTGTPEPRVSELLQGLLGG